jgi:gliding motility-associated-like protein
VCSIWLRVDQSNESEKQFFWTPLKGWKEGVARYELIRTSENSDAQILDMGLSENHLIEGRDPASQKISYQIRAIPNNLGFYPNGSFSNKIELLQKEKFRFPEVFTPNQDGVNEEFRCYSLFISEFEMKIFNAWGSVVFFSDGLDKGWDGKINTHPAPSGPYAYWAKGKDESGKEIEVRGSFTLVR